MGVFVLIGFVLMLIPRISCSPDPSDITLRDSHSEEDSENEFFGDKELQSLLRLKSAKRGHLSRDIEKENHAILADCPKAPINQPKYDLDSYNDNDNDNDNDKDQAKHGISLNNHNDDSNVGSNRAISLSARAILMNVLLLIVLAGFMVAIMAALYSLITTIYS